MTKLHTRLVHMNPQLSLKKKLGVCLYEIETIYTSDKKESLVMKECVVTSYCLVLSGSYQRNDDQIGRYYLWKRWLRYSVLLMRSTRTAASTFPYALWKYWYFVMCHFVWSIAYMKSHTHRGTHLVILYVYILCIRQRWLYYVYTFS